MHNKECKRTGTVFVCLILFLAGLAFLPVPGGQVTWAVSASSEPEILSEIPDYCGEPYTVVNDNVPDFDEADFTVNSFELYSDLDSLGRCGAAYANLGTDLMPTEGREDISSVYPTGWVQNVYDEVSGGYLYNRCHLIAFELAAENANEKNLITGTRYLNVEGMLPFENMVADYIKETKNHVLYRVTPVFEGDNLVASGVQMEAQSVEDDGDGILYNIYCYNVQPGITIDYATGENWLSDSDTAGQMSDPADHSETEEEVTYVLNTNSMKFHYSYCRYAETISEKNRLEYTGTREEIIAQGYEACKVCNP